MTNAARRIENEALTETNAGQLSYWTAFADFLRSGESAIRPQKPRPQHWMNFSVGRAGFLLGALLNTTDRRIGVELYLNDVNAKAYYRILNRQRTEIEEALGFPLIWMELPDRKACRLVTYFEGVDPLDECRWPEFRNWMRSRLETMNAVFRPRIRSLDASHWTLDDTSDLQLAP